VSPLAHKNLETSNFDNRDKLTDRQEETFASMLFLATRTLGTTAMSYTPLTAETRGAL